MTDDLSQTLSWLHFGDLHITTEDQPNYRDFLALIEDANENITGGIDFAVLPGDNADDGTAEQYDLIRRAIEGLRIPLEIRTGDHDRKSGTLDAYQAVLEPQLWRNRIVGPYRCLFLNSLIRVRRCRSYAVRARSACACGRNSLRHRRPRRCARRVWQPVSTRHSTTGTPPPRCRRPGTAAERVGARGAGTPFRAAAARRNRRRRATVSCSDPNPRRPLRQCRPA